MGVETGGNIVSSSASSSVGMEDGRRTGALFGVVGTPSWRCLHAHTPGSHLQSFPLTHCKPMPGPERGQHEQPGGPLTREVGRHPLLRAPLPPVSFSQQERGHANTAAEASHDAALCCAFNCHCSGGTKTEHLRKCTFLTWASGQGFVLPVFRSPLARLLFSFWLQRYEVLQLTSWPNLITRRKK